MSCSLIKSTSHNRSSITEFAVETLEDVFLRPVSFIHNSAPPIIRKVCRAEGGCARAAPHSLNSNFSLLVSCHVYYFNINWFRIAKVNCRWTHSWTADRCIIQQPPTDTRGKLWIFLLPDGWPAFVPCFSDDGSLDPISVCGPATLVETQSAFTAAGCEPVRCLCLRTPLEVRRRALRTCTIIGLLDAAPLCPLTIVRRTPVAVNGWMNQN